MMPEVGDVDSVWEAPQFGLDSEPGMPVGLSVRRLGS